LERKIHLLKADPNIPSPEAYNIYSEFDKKNKGYTFGVPKKDLNHQTFNQGLLSKLLVPGPGQYNPKEIRKKPSYSFTKVMVYYSIGCKSMSKSKDKVSKDSSSKLFLRQVRKSL